MNGKDELFNYGEFLMKTSEFSSWVVFLVPEGTSAECSMSLTGGLDSCSGNLFVQYGGHQGLVCEHPSWHLKKVLVICKQLGCGHAYYTYQCILRPEEMETPWLYGVQYHGKEATTGSAPQGPGDPLMPMNASV